MQAMEAAAPAESNETQGPFYFKLPALLVISGATGSGKSTIAAEICRYRNEIIKPQPQVIIWVYNVYQDELFKQVLEHAPGTLFVQGMEEFRRIKLSTGVHHLVILDDMLAQIVDSKEHGIQLMTTEVHHRSLFCIFLVQSMYTKSKFNSLLMRQARYLLIFENKRNSFEVNMLGRELGIRSVDIQRMFKDASGYLKRVYLLFDCDPDTADNRRILIHFLPWQKPRFFYHVENR
jgi:NB-ARC domain